MDNNYLIRKFEEVKKMENSSLRSIWQKSIPLVKLTKDIIPSELYKNLDIELQCLYYEFIYGGDEDDEIMVKNDFYMTIEKVLIHLRQMK
jgi:hypothetical protein